MIGFVRPWLLFSLISLPLAWYFGRSVTKKTTNLILRLFSLLLISLAAAGMRITAPSDAVSAIFVLDVSDSMGSGSRDGLTAINKLLKGVKGGDQAGLVSFASSAGLESSLRPGSAAFETVLRHDGGSSKLADGIYTAVGALPNNGSEQRIVLVSDGRDDGGGLADALEFAGASGILVDVLPSGYQSDNEVLVESLSVPGSLAEGEVHSLTAVIRSEDATAARILIIRDGVLVGEDRKGLKRGTQRRSWEMPGLESGTHTYEIIVDPATDGSPDNNHGLALSTVSGPSKVLWVGRGVSAIPGALEVQGHIVDRRSPGELPDSITGYTGFEAVILDNVSARDLSLGRMDILESWVRTRGGGLMMVGGDEAFGPGGWQSTSIEKALPVDMDAPSSLYIPSLTMVMVVDKSGSMGGSASTGFTKLDLVKEAVLGASEVLNPLFSVGLLAFDADYEWTVPVTEAGNSSVIRSGLAGLDSGGGTVLYPAVEEAYNALVASPSAVRHLVILSDGLTERGDFEGLVTAIARDGISVSTVAVGADSEQKLMETMARFGNGRYWYAEDATQVPRIFASESMIVSRGLTVEETVFPEGAMSAEALNGIDLSSLPPLHGYVMTYPNPASVEALRSPRGHPILVYGQHGLGRTIAFTSDLRSGWGRDWAVWEELPQLLSQSVRWMNGGERARDAVFTMRGQDGEVVLTLEARTESGGTRSNLYPRAVISTPDRRELEIPLTQTAPGRYEGRFKPALNGVYGGSIFDESSGLAAQAWWTRAYNPELGRSGTDMAVLAETARLGGGRLLNTATLQDEADTWWQVRSPSDRTRLDLTALLAFASLLIFVADIALRESAEWRRKDHEEPSAAGGGTDMDALILKGREDERHKPKNRRPTPSEAARLLAQRRMEKEK